MSMDINRLKGMGIGFRSGPVDASADRPSLVMVHGAGGTSRIWQNQIRSSRGPSARLSRSVKSVALDLPGHGQSPGPAHSDIDGYSKWLCHVLCKVCSDEPPFVMGHSMGGAIVQKAVLSDPDLVKGIILVGTGPRLRVAPMFLEGLQKNFDIIVGTLMGYAYADNADQRLIKEGIKLMKAAGADVAYGDFCACDHFDVRNQIAGMDLPCLILCGSKDKLAPPSLSQKLHESIRGSKMALIPDAGHMVMIEEFQRFNDHVLDFILNS